MLSEFDVEELKRLTDWRYIKDFSINEHKDLIRFLSKSILDLNKEIQSLKSKIGDNNAA